MSKWTLTGNATSETATYDEVLPSDYFASRQIASAPDLQFKTVADCVLAMFGKVRTAENKRLKAIQPDAKAKKKIAVMIGAAQGDVSISRTEHLPFLHRQLMRLASRKVRFDGTDDENAALLAFADKVVEAIGHNVREYSTAISEQTFNALFDAIASDDSDELADGAGA